MALKRQKSTRAGTYGMVLYSDECDVGRRLTAFEHADKLHGSNHHLGRLTYSRSVASFSCVFQVICTLIVLCLVGSAVMIRFLGDCYFVQYLLHPAGFPHQPLQEH